MAQFGTITAPGTSAPMQFAGIMEVLWSSRADGVPSTGGKPWLVAGGKPLAFCYLPASLDLVSRRGSWVGGQERGA